MDVWAACKPTCQSSNSGAASTSYVESCLVLNAEGDFLEDFVRFREEEAAAARLGQVNEKVLKEIGLTAPSRRSPPSICS
jgi:hypothetical protein